MSYKTILVHCDASRAVGTRLAAAAQVAQRFEARLVGLHAREPFEVVSFVDGGMALEPLMEAYRAGCEAAEKTAQSAYDKATKGRNFPSEWRVTEAFSDAGSSFYQQVLFLTEGFSDGGGHLLLLRTKLEIAASGKDAGGGKKIANLFNEVLANGCIFQSADQTNESNS